MDLYLLDTNFASVLWDGLHKEHQNALSFVQNLGGENHLYISRITVAEIEYGYKVHLGADANRKQVIEKAMRAFKVREIDRHTTAPYSDIRAALFQRYAPKNKRGLPSKKRPEELIDKTSARELGIQENDLWVAAIAVQHNMILVTEDRISHISEVENRLQCINWRTGNPCKPPAS